MSGEKISTKGGGEEIKFNIPNNGEVVSIDYNNAQEQGQNSYMAFEDEAEYNNETSETRKESAVADNKERKLFLEGKLAQFDGYRTLRVGFSKKELAEFGFKVA